MQIRLTIASGNFDFEHQLLPMETRNLKEGTSNYTIPFVDQHQSGELQ